MSCGDQVTKFIQRVSIVGAASAGVPIVFPTALIAKTQTSNGQAAVGAGVDAVVLAANLSRKFAQIVNLSGTTMYIAFGAAADATKLPLPNNAVFTVDANTIGEINKQAVHVFNPSGGALAVNVYEE